MDVNLRETKLYKTGLIRNQKFSNTYGDKSKRRDFNSRNEYKAFKADTKELANLESNYKSAESNFKTTQASIDEFSSVDTEGFKQVDNLINAETASTIDVIVNYGPTGGKSGGAFTETSGKIDTKTG